MLIIDLALALLVTGVFATNVTHPFAAYVLTIFAAGFDGRSNFHNRGDLGRRSGRNSARSGRGDQLSISGETSVISAETIDDTSFF